MRVIGKFPYGNQVGMAVDSLRNIGLHREDMIITNIAEDEKFDSLDGEARESIPTKNERDALGETQSFTAGIEGLTGNEGIVIAVECPKHFADRARRVLEDSGAMDIVID